MSIDLAATWSGQIAWCDENGAPFTARVLEAAWSDWLAGGALRELLPDWPGDARADAVALRVAGALHALALEGVDRALAALYPPRSATFDPVEGPPAVRNALLRFRDRVADYLQRPPQTNEIGRSATLLGGFAIIAARTGLPLALREIGASAGLNTLWDRYRYDLRAARWGDPASPVLIRAEWQGEAPVLPPRIAVSSRRACDVTPIDLRRSGAATRLMSYVWPDHPERLARLRVAITLGAVAGVAIEQMDAADFTARELSEPRNGAATVLYHSIVWQYLPAPTRVAIRQTLRAAGARATPEAPLARLALEVPDPKSWPKLSLTLWPGGERVLLAEAHPHGNVVRWSSSPA